jgi:6-phosphogluconate dehydrogenase (decarboxylating)
MMELALILLTATLLLGIFALDGLVLSRGEGDLTHQMLSAMRHDFGGHLEKRVEDDR